MKVSMAEVNKKANLIINQVAESGEVAVIFKRGKPIAEIRPVSSDASREKALEYLSNIKPIKVGSRAWIEAISATGSACRSSASASNPSSRS